MGEVVGIPRKASAKALPMPAEDAHEVLGRLYGLYELAGAVTAGRFDSLEELQAELWAHVDMLQQHLMCAGVTVSWCTCGAIGGAPCVVCAGGPAPFECI